MEPVTSSGDESFPPPPIFKSGNEMTSIALIDQGYNLKKLGYIDVESEGDRHHRFSVSPSWPRSSHRHEVEVAEHRDRAPGSAQ